MTYCIMTVIYGIPLTEEASRKIDEWEDGVDGEEPLPDGDDRWFENNDGACGFKTLYSGSAPWHPGYCGVELCKFDECSDAIDAKELRLTPTPKEIDEAMTKIKELHPDLRTLCGEPGVWIIPSSS